MVPETGLEPYVATPKTFWRVFFYIVRCHKYMTIRDVDVIIGLNIELVLTGESGLPTG